MEKFNFSKPEDQEKFEKISPEEKNVVVDDATVDAFKIKKYAHELQGQGEKLENVHYKAGEIMADREKDDPKNMELYEIFRSYGLGYDVMEKYSNFSELKEVLSAEGYSEVYIMGLYAKMRGLSESLYRDEDYYKAFNLFRFFGMEERIKERVLQSIRYGEKHRNQPCLDLFEGICKHGNEEQIRQATHEYFSEKLNSIGTAETIEFFRNKLKEVGVYVKDYCKKNKIPLTQPIDTYAINAAGELLKNDYDLVIGVIKSGTPVAVLLEIAGKQVQYVEWHKHWTKGPKWCKIGGIQKRLEKAKKVLLCEHDTHTGATLEALNPFLQKLDSEHIDVNYLVDVHDTNEFYSEMIPKLQNVYNIKYDLPIENFYENLDLFLNLVRKEKL